MRPQGHDCTRFHGTQVKRDIIYLGFVSLAPTKPMANFMPASQSPFTRGPVRLAPIVAPGTERYPAKINTDVKLAQTIEGIHDLNVATNEGNPVLVNPTNNDTDTDMDALPVVNFAAISTQGGTATDTGNNILEHTPPPESSGMASSPCP